MPLEPHQKSILLIMRARLLGNLGSVPAEGEMTP